MNIRNLTFSLSLLLIYSSLVKSAEMEQKVKEEKKLSNYEKLLSFFPNVQSALKNYKITKEDINDAKRLTIWDETAFFRKMIDGKKTLVTIIQDKSNKTGYKITIHIK